MMPIILRIITVIILIIIVSTDQGKNLAKQISAVFLETSAKDNESVTDLFHNILVQIETLNGDMAKGVEDKKSCSLM